MFTITRRLLLLLGLLLSCASTLSLASAQEVKEEKGENTVTLTVDYGDGVRKEFTAIPWKEKLTAFDALQAAAKHPRGIKFKHRGAGAATLVVTIDDLSNQAGGNSWLYEVNGQLADRSCAVYELKAGDTLLWKFGNYR
jgi:hypothetical protein